MYVCIIKVQSIYDIRKSQRFSHNTIKKIYRSTVDKTKSADSRKKGRTQEASSSTFSRKFGTNGSTVRRGSTTSVPITSKRVSSSRPKYRTVSRPKTSNEEQEDREVSRRSYDPSSDEDVGESGDTVRVTEKIERPKNRNRGKTQSLSSADRNTRRKQSRRKGQTKTNEGEGSLSNKLTTPEPPTTPDPGTGESSLRRYGIVQVLSLKMAKAQNDN